MTARLGKIEPSQPVRVPLVVGEACSTPRVAISIVRWVNGRSRTSAGMPVVARGTSSPSSPLRQRIARTSAPGNRHPILPHVAALSS